MLSAFLILMLLRFRESGQVVHALARGHAFSLRGTSDQACKTSRSNNDVQCFLGEVRQRALQLIGSDPCMFAALQFASKQVSSLEAHHFLCIYTRS